jgi:hypothetical protein
MRDFSAATRRALSRKGIEVYGICVIPAQNDPMPFANGDRGYKVNDNGCGRIWTFAQVLEAAR